MATKRTRSTRSRKGRSWNPLDNLLFEKDRSAASKKRKSKDLPPPPKEPLASRVWGSAILIIAVLMLFSAMFPPIVAMILVGGLVLATAFPPMRGPVDVWLTGKRRGKTAEQAAAIRMALGALTIFVTLIGAVGR